MMRYLMSIAKRNACKSIGISVVVATVTRIVEVFIDLPLSCGTTLVRGLGIYVRKVVCT